VIFLRIRIKAFLFSIENVTLQFINTSFNIDVDNLNVGPILRKIFVCHLLHPCEEFYNRYHKFRRYGKQRMVDSLYPYFDHRVNISNGDILNSTIADLITQNYSLIICTTGDQAAIYNLSSLYPNTTFASANIQPNVTPQNHPNLMLWLSNLNSDFYFIIGSVAGMVTQTKKGLHSNSDELEDGFWISKSKNPNH